VALAPRFLLLPTLALPALGAVLLDCNLLIGADDYSVGASWGCVGSGAPAVRDAGDVTLTLAVRHLGAEPIPGVSIQTCDKLDPGCMRTSPGFTTTDASGVATIHVGSGFDGYLDVRGTLPLSDGGADAGDAGTGGGELMRRCST
jgi:hypothetical protein